MIHGQPSDPSSYIAPDNERYRAALRERVMYHRAMARLHPPREPPISWDDFKEFVRGMAVLLGAPIIIPMRLIHDAITSPLTISLVIKLMLLGLLLLASSVFSVLAVGAFFWSWKIGGNVEVEGWLFYGSKNHRAPHTTVYFPLEKIEHDMRYDVQVELELVRPTKGTTDEMGNFMLSLEMRALDHPDRILITAAQPSLPPAALPSPFLSLPVLPTSYLPCIIPYPFRSLCPSRLLGYSVPTAKIRERRAKGGFSSRERGKDVVPLKKDLMEGVVIKPGKSQGMVIGSGFVSIGREDLFDNPVEKGEKCKPPSREVKTTGWVLIRLIPKPTGIRWILSSHPIPPLLLLPPITISLTFSSSIIAFAIITLLKNGKGKSESNGKDKLVNPVDKPKPQIEGQGGFAAADGIELDESARRRQEWDEMESSLGNGMPREGGAVKGSVSSSTIGGSDTTLPSTSTHSFGPTMMTRTTSGTSTGSSASASASSSTSPSTSDSAETITISRLRDQGQSVTGSDSSSSESSSGGSSSSVNRGTVDNLRRRESGRKSSPLSSNSISSGVIGSNTETERGSGIRGETEDEGDETEIEGGGGGGGSGRRERDDGSDWREFGREFGLNT